MTDLKQLALAFCKECLGWADALPAPDGIAMIFKPGDQQTGNHLEYDDREDVSESVEAWCYAEKLDYQMHHESEHGIWELLLFSNDRRLPGGRFDGGLYHTFCEAMLACCVDAARMLEDREKSGLIAPI